MIKNYDQIVNRKNEELHIVELHQHNRNSTLHLLQPNTTAKVICWNQMRN
jgi:hypothetical protein